MLCYENICQALIFFNKLCGILVDVKMLNRGFLVGFILFWSLTTFAQEGRKHVVIETDSGNITIALYDVTPLHRDNFIKLTNQGFYDGTAFHRVIENFMIQGGDPYSKEGATGKPGNGGPGYTIPAEINPALYHKKGALCAARKGDNVNPNRESSGSQFYIVQGTVFDSLKLAGFEQRINHDIKNKIVQEFYADPANKAYAERMKQAQVENNQEEIKAIIDEISPIIDRTFETRRFRYTREQRQTYATLGGTPHLDMQYTVFGEVIDGLDVIDRIAGSKKNGESPIVPQRMTVKVVD